MVVLPKWNGGNLNRFNWDALGTGASLLCAVHCALLPVLATALPFFSLPFFENPVVEYGLLLMSFCIGFIALFNAFRTGHGKLMPVFLFCIAFPVLVWAHLSLHGIVAYVLIALSALLIMVAHLLNFRSYRAQCSLPPYNTVIKEEVLKSRLF